MNKTTISILMLLAILPMAFAGNFKIQQPVGTDIFIVDTSGNVNASGTIYENNVLLSSTYCALTGCTFSSGIVDFSSGTTVFVANDIAESEINFTTVCASGSRLYVSGGNLACEVATSSGNSTEQMQDAALAVITGGEGVNYTYDDTGNAANIQFDCSEVTDEAGDHLSCVGENLVVADDWWNALGDISLTSAQILVGSAGNVAAAVAMTGDVTITNAGVTAIGNDKVTEADLKAVNSAVDEKVLTYESSTGDFEWHWANETITDGTGLTWAGNTLNLDNDFGVDISSAELASEDFGDFTCTGDAGGCSLDTTYLENVVEDVTPQLGGDLDLNGKKLMRAGVATNATIDATGNFIIVLSS